MGRPLSKDVLGTDARGTYASTGTGITVTGYFEGSKAAYYIYKQRGAKTYVVTADGTTFYTGVLKDGTPSANGEIQITGRVDVDTDQATNKRSIAKLTKRIATDFAGNRYTWYLAEDSSSDDLILTAV